MAKNESLLLRLSADDMRILEKLSASQGLRKSEYIRMLIQTIHIAESLREDKNGNMRFEIGEYGYILEKEFIEQYAKQMETFFMGIEKQMQRAIISQPKPNKRVMMRKVVKPKKVA